MQLNRRVKNQIYLQQQLNICSKEFFRSKLVNEAISWWGRKWGYRRYWSQVTHALTYRGKQNSTKPRQVSQVQISSPANRETLYVRTVVTIHSGLNRHTCSRSVILTATRSCRGPENAHFISIRQVSSDAAMQWRGTCEHCCTARCCRCSRSCSAAAAYCIMQFAD